MQFQGEPGRLIGLIPPGDRGDPGRDGFMVTLLDSSSLANLINHMQQPVEYFHSTVC